MNFKEWYKSEYPYEYQRYESDKVEIKTDKERTYSFLWILFIVSVILFFISSFLLYFWGYYIENFKINFY